MYYKSEVVDTIINLLESQMRHEKKHLLKTDTIIRLVAFRIDLSDELPEREELLAIGIKQVIQGRLYAHGYFSIQTGYFVNIEQCENLFYLQNIIDNKDSTIESKVKARNRIKVLKGLDGQMVLVPDQTNAVWPQETKTAEELQADIEADAV